MFSDNTTLELKEMIDRANKHMSVAHSGKTIPYPSVLVSDMRYKEVSNEIKFIM